MIIVNARIFDLSMTQRFSFQFLIILPKVGLVSNQLYHRFDDLAKQPAANNKKGVVGNTGNTTPSVAKPTNKKPKILYINFETRLDEEIIVSMT